MLPVAVKVIPSAEDSQIKPARLTPEEVEAVTTTFPPTLQNEEGEADNVNVVGNIVTVVVLIFVQPIAVLESLADKV